MRTALAMSLWLVGCGSTPGVLWHGWSADREHRARVLEHQGRWRVEVDGVVERSWDAVAVGHLRWTEDGQLAYPALDGEDWRLIVGGRAGAPHVGVGEVTVAGPMIAYCALDEDGWRVVVDGVSGPAFRSLRPGSLVLAPDRGRAAYIAADDAGEHAVVDGRVGMTFARVETVRFAAKGEQVVYVGFNAAGARVVVDGEPGAVFDDVLELSVASEAPHWAAIVQRDGRSELWRDGTPVAVGPVSGLRQTPDGRHVAWLEASEGGVRLFRDGERVGTWPRVERLHLVPGTGATLFVERTERGQRLVHGRRAGPRFDRIEHLQVSRSRHWGYVGCRPAGCAVVVDAVAVHRGEWAGGLVLAARGDGWAAVARHGARRFVVTPEGHTPVARPFVETLVLDPLGTHWALGVAVPETRELRVVVDGRDVASLDVDEVIAGMAQADFSRSLEQVARTLVAAQLAAHVRDCHAGRPSRGSPGRAGPSCPRGSGAFGSRAGP